MPDLGFVDVNTKNTLILGSKRLWVYDCICTVRVHKKVQIDVLDDGTQKCKQGDTVNANEMPVILFA